MSASLSIQSTSHCCRRKAAFCASVACWLFTDVNAMLLGMQEERYDGRSHEPRSSRPPLGFTSFGTGIDKTGHFNAYLLQKKKKKYISCLQGVPALTKGFGSFTFY
jgi:hypothetical protein